MSNRPPSQCAGCNESEGDCPACKENAAAIAANAHRTDPEHMLETAKQALAETEALIVQHEKMRATWLKVCGSLEYQIHGRILP